MLKRSYDIILLFKEYFLLAFYIAVALLLLATNQTSQVRAMRAGLLSATGALQDVFGVVPNYFALREENSVLREQNLTLNDEVNRLREARLENIRLHRLLGLKDRPAFRYLSARVVGATSQNLRNTITIDRGLGDGVLLNMPVVTADGLAGRVSSVSSKYAIVHLLLHRDVRVSARVERSRVNGIVRWTGGRSLSFANVPTSFDVQEGDVVITSEFSSMFPAGIRIGVVSGTRTVPGDLFRAVDLSPVVDFDRLEEVFIALHTPDSGRVAIDQRP
jgi:rod shape-determining protein MreC